MKHVWHRSKCGNECNRVREWGMDGQRDRGIEQGEGHTLALYEFFFFLFLFICLFWRQSLSRLGWPLSRVLGSCTAQTSVVFVPGEGNMPMPFSFCLRLTLLLLLSCHNKNFLWYHRSVLSPSALNSACTTVEHMYLSFFSFPLFPQNPYQHLNMSTRTSWMEPQLPHCHNHTGTAVSHPPDPGPLLISFLPIAMEVKTLRTCLTITASVAMNLHLPWITQTWLLLPLCPKTNFSSSSSNFSILFSSRASL